MKSYQVLIGLLILPLLAMATLPKKGKPQVKTKAQIAAKKRAPRMKADEVLVKYKTGVTSASKAKSLNAIQATHLATIGSARLEHVKIRPGLSVNDAIAEFKADPNVESVQPNFIYHIAAVPNDPQYSQQWSLNNTAQTVTGADYTSQYSSVAGIDMGLQQAWDIRTDCSSTIVAVIDTGVYYTHEDLAANMWNGGTAYPLHGYNFIDNNNDPMDTNGHGSQVAGIIGAVGNNGKGISGVCWKASIMAVRVFDSSGNASSAAVVAGLDFAAKNGAKVINMSFNNYDNDAAENAELQTLASQNIVLVAAAGNDGNDNDSTPSYPCGYATPNMICVAALDQSGALADFSNYGATSVHVGAPGANILTSSVGAADANQDPYPGYYWSKSGGWTDGFYTLVIPANYDGTMPYASNLNAHAFNTYDVTGFKKATVTLSLDYDIKAGDHLKVAYNSAGTDPFATNSTGVALADITGASANSASLTYDVTACASTSCAIGLQLTSGTTAHGAGVNLTTVEVDRTSIDPTTYQILDGTSAAAAQVSGVAALLFSQNPSYTATHLISNIEASGTPMDSLTAATSTGNAINAFNAINYIAPPTNFHASSQ